MRYTASNCSALTKKLKPGTHTAAYHTPCTQQPDDKQILKHAHTHPISSSLVPINIQPHYTPLPFEKKSILLYRNT